MGTLYWLTLMCLKRLISDLLGHVGFAKDISLVFDVDVL